MSKIESSVRTVLAFNQAFNRHDIPTMMALMSADVVFENTAPAPDGTVYQGKEAITRFWEEFFEKSPQALITIEDIFGLGRRCVMRWRYEWVDEQGENGHVRGVDIYRIEDDLIVEKLSYVKG